MKKNQGSILTLYADLTNELSCFDLEEIRKGVDSNITIGFIAILVSE